MILYRALFESSFVSTSRLLIRMLLALVAAAGLDSGLYTCSKFYLCWLKLLVMFWKLLKSNNFCLFICCRMLLIFSWIACISIFCSFIAIYNSFEQISSIIFVFNIFKCSIWMVSWFAVNIWRKLSFTCTGVCTSFTAWDSWLSDWVCASPLYWGAADYGVTSSDLWFW